MAEEKPKTLRYRILRYTPNLIRDEWANIGVLLEEVDGTRHSMRSDRGFVGDCIGSGGCTRTPTKTCCARCPPSSMPRCAARKQSVAAVH